MLKQTSTFKIDETFRLQSALYLLYVSLSVGLLVYSRGTSQNGLTDFYILIFFMRIYWSYILTK